MAEQTSEHSYVCWLFASALFVALCWPRVNSVRRREQPSSVCLPSRAETVAAVQTADSCISLASSICYLETSDFITADQCSCTLWLSPRLSLLSVCLLVSHSPGLYLIGFWTVCLCCLPLFFLPLSFPLC